VAAKAKKKPVNPHHLTAKQLAADRANLARARAAQKGKARTAKQQAASRQNLAKARAAQKSRRSGKKPVTKKAAQAPDGLARCDVSIEGVPLHSLPVCAAVAVAASLQRLTGTGADPREIWALHKLAGRTSIEAVIEAAAEHGLAGHRITGFWPLDPGLLLDGLVYGVQIQQGYHAVLGVPGGMLSWDTVLPLSGEPEEAWAIEWAHA
jgi:hypothetical protein